MRPGLTDAQLRRGEQILGFELLPDIRTFMSWATCGPDGITFLPSHYPASNWLQPNLALQSSRSMPHVGDGGDKYPEWCRPSPRPLKMAVLFKGWTAFDHGEGPTRGGMWIWDMGGEGWMAPSFSHLIDVCLELAERDWLTADERGHLMLNDEAKAAAKVKEAEFYEQQPDHTEPIDLEWHLETLRLDVYDNPQLVTPRRRDWIWD